MSLLSSFTIDQLNCEVYDSRSSMGAEAAEQVAAKIRELQSRRDEVNIIFAAAPSQNEFLAGLLGADGIDWGGINAFHMDEYIGLTPGAPQGFGEFLRERLFSRAAFKSVSYIDGNAADIGAECGRYARLLGAYPPDIVCMGVGENGHIAFNDPHAALFNDPEAVKVVELDEKCRMQQVNDGCFDSIENVPTHAVTLTIPALMRGKAIFCVVPARSKAWAVRDTLRGEISGRCPASVLRTHADARLYLDQDSAGLLR